VGRDWHSIKNLHGVVTISNPQSTQRSPCTQGSSGGRENQVAERERIIDDFSNHRSRVADRRIAGAKSAPVNPCSLFFCGEQVTKLADVISVNSLISVSLS
jgi:hypothetical protein